MNALPHGHLPIPAFYDAELMEELFVVDYQAIQEEAFRWAELYNVPPAVKTSEEYKVTAIPIDVQLTFCSRMRHTKKPVPNLLFVAGQNGMGAVEDTARLCEFLYRELVNIDLTIPTLDTHKGKQIFHPIFWVDEKGKTVRPFTLITYDDVREGRYSVNPAVAFGALNTADLHGLRQLKAMDAIMRRNSKDVESSHLWYGPIILCWGLWTTLLYRVCRKRCFSTTVSVGGKRCTRLKVRIP